MHPRDTAYYLCTKPAHYRACHTLFDELQEPKRPLAFPTVYAQRGTELIGFLSSYTKGGAVCAGPLLVDPIVGHTAFIAVRLLEAYESVLRQAGVTQYLFGVDKQKPAWRAAVERFGCTSYGEAPDTWWFKREL